MNGTNVDSGSWAGKTYAEIRNMGETDGSILVIPFGSLEQHGHHLPTATDTLLVTAIAHGGVEQVVDDIPVLVTPPIWSGYSINHIAGFGGTVSATFTTLLALLQEVTESTLGNAFDAILLVNGHGGNHPLIGAAVRQIGAAHPEVEVLGLTYFDLAAPVIDRVRDSDTGGMWHAGEFETSLMLHLHPELVRTDRMSAEYRDPPYDLEAPDMFTGGPLIVYRPSTSYSDSGTAGDPTLATEEKGEQLYGALVDSLAELLTAIHRERSK